MRDYPLIEMPNHPKQILLSSLLISHSRHGNQRISDKLKYPRVLISRQKIFIFLFVKCVCYARAYVPILYIYF